MRGKVLMSALAALLGPTTAGIAHGFGIRAPAQAAKIARCRPLRIAKRVNVAQPPQRPMPPWTSSTNWIQ